MEKCNDLYILDSYKLSEIKMIYLCYYDINYGYNNAGTHC